MLTPQAVATGFTVLTVCTVTGYALLLRQARNHAVEKAALRRQARRAAMRQQRAEVVVRDLCGTWLDPECADLLPEERAEFDAITGQLGVDIGLGILGSEGEGL